MAGNKQSLSKPRKPLREILTDALTTALENHDDVIIVFETVPDEEQRVHVMVGKLISPIMLGMLSHWCEIQSDEGSRHVAIKIPGQNKLRKNEDILSLY